MPIRKQVRKVPGRRAPHPNANVEEAIQGFEGTLMHAGEHPEDKEAQENVEAHRQAVIDIHGVDPLQQRQMVNEQDADRDH
jgi:hypothetical protein